MLPRGRHYLMVHTVVEEVGLMGGLDKVIESRMILGMGGEAMEWAQKYQVAKHYWEESIIWHKYTHEHWI